MTTVRRTLSIAFCLFVAAIASVLAADVFLTDGLHWLDLLGILLLTINTAWLAWGAAVAFNGLLSSHRPIDNLQSEDTRSSASVAVLVPIYNEDPVKTFSHVAAMARSLVEAGAKDRFHFAILSDTNQQLVARKEEFWFARLRAELADEVCVFYRRRQANPGKKAGNIADFIRTSGGNYDYLIILDADSLMEGATMVEMVRRMEAEPRLGLLQSLPKVIHARSLFGRAIAFASSFYSPTFGHGLAKLQGREGSYWGHNAIVRTRAFAQSCGLPVLSGKPPFGGHILSHDFVEAALLVRNGWHVRLDADLDGSYEEGPDNVVDYAKRDRRWCQGNLQHSRVLTVHGLRPWSRFFFLQGIMAFLASPIWALFLATTIIAQAATAQPSYFSDAGVPLFPRVGHLQGLTLLTGVFGLLVGPKVLVILRGVVTGDNRPFGGTIRVLWSGVVELVTSSVMAPIMLLYQSRSVAQVFLGLDSGWPAADREASEVGLGEAWAASWWICATGCITLGVTYQLAPDIVYWVLLVAGPAIASPLLIQVTSLRSSGRYAGWLGLFQTPEERQSAPIIVQQEAVLARWRANVVPTTAEQEPQDLLSRGTTP